MAGLFVILATQGLRTSYEPAQLTRPKSEDLVRQRDVGFIDGSYPYLGNDEASYAAMAERPLADDYLSRRAPFGFRLAEPTLVYVLGRFGLDRGQGFQLVGFVGLLCAGMAIGTILQAEGRSKPTAAAAAALFVMTPAALDGLIYPHIIDAGAWALMFWAWERWIKGHTRAAIALLVIAILWRETATIIALCMMVHGLRARRSRRSLFALGGTALIALALPHVLVQPSFTAPLGVLVDRVFDARGAAYDGWTGLGRFVLAYTVDGAGLAIIALVLIKRPVKTSVWPLVWLIPAMLLVSLAAFNISRLLVPAALPVLVMMSERVDDLEPRARAAALSFLVVLTASYDLTYARAHPSVLIVALGLFAVVVARIAIRDRERSATYA
jgi:hypothetical protein